MKKLFVLSAIAVLAACGGSDPKPADPSTTNNTSTTAPASTETPAPASTDSAAAPASTDAAPAATPPKK
ncbi:MAG: hypothetical protein BGO98_49640 [Myxococcales bacterium 68-20]|nr:hypothetical protein [Myxococcales bacterium]OJY29878.1 MAG: hypothetical protein BGO98_49640 [Myxococcales bacterium 68-20]